MDTQISNFLQTHLNSSEQTIALTFEGKASYQGQRSKGFVVQISPNQKLPNAYARNYNLSSVNFI